MELRVRVSSLQDPKKLMSDIEPMFMVLEGIGECAVLKIGEHEIPLRFCNDLTIEYPSPHERTLEFDLKSIRK